MVGAGDTKWLKRYCLLKDRQLFFFPSKPTSQFADPVGRVFLELCTKLALSEGLASAPIGCFVCIVLCVVLFRLRCERIGGDNQVIKIAEKIGSKTRGFFLASNKSDKLDDWMTALELELEKVAAERDAGLAQDKALQTGSWLLCACGIALDS